MGGTRKPHEANRITRIYRDSCPKMRCLTVKNYGVCNRRIAFSSKYGMRGSNMNETRTIRFHFDVQVIWSYARFTVEDGTAP